MRSIARTALVNGMEVANDVFNYQKELIIPAGTIIDTGVIRKLNIYSIVAVNIMEDVDYATTYFDKTRLSKGFISFNETYNKVLPLYKEHMINCISHKVPISTELLLRLFHQIIDPVKDKNNILDYLYNMPPGADDMTHAHCLNSALIAGVFAPWLKLSPENSEILVLCAFCYDVGKLMLPNSLIWKPDKLTDAEFIKIKSHTLLGFELLKDLNLNPHIIKATLMHHERCDGSGYPSRIKGERIDTFAKLVAIIDCYEAMTSARMYRQSKHPFKVIASFEEMGFPRFDARLLQPILFNIAHHLVGKTVLLSNEQQAQIVKINSEWISRPLVKSADDIMIDLSIESLEIMGLC